MPYYFVKVRLYNGKTDVCGDIPASTPDEAMQKAREKGYNPVGIQKEINPPEGILVSFSNQWPPRNQWEAFQQALIKAPIIGKVYCRIADCHLKMPRTFITFVTALSLLLLSSTAIIYYSTAVERLNCRGSSAIKKAIYNKRSKEMSVWFVGNRRDYTYPDFPETLWNRWERADSKGRFYDQWIKGERFEKD